MFSKIIDSMSIKSKTPKSTPPASAPTSRPPSPRASRSSISSLSTPFSSRRASLSDHQGNSNNNNFPGMNPAYEVPSDANNFTGATPPAGVSKNNFPGMASKKAVRNNFFGTDTTLTNDFGVMNPQGTRNNFPGDN